MASQEQIIAGLLVNGTVTATAEQLGMSRAGIYKAMQAESFNEEYDDDIPGLSISTYYKKYVITLLAPY